MLSKKILNITDVIKIRLIDLIMFVDSLSDAQTGGHFDGKQFVFTVKERLKRSLENDNYIIVNLIRHYELFYDISPLFIYLQA